MINIYLWGLIDGIGALNSDFINPLVKNINTETFERKWALTLSLKKLYFN